jgi:hypothetical protein
LSTDANHCPGAVIFVFELPPFRSCNNDTLPQYPSSADAVQVSPMPLPSTRFGKVFLHTGDFRFHDDMIPVFAGHVSSSTPCAATATAASCHMKSVSASLSHLSGIVIDGVYLDTTYCSPQHCFPPQHQSIQYVVSAIQDSLLLDNKSSSHKHVPKSSSSSSVVSIDDNKKDHNRTLGDSVTNTTAVNTIDDQTLDDLISSIPDDILTSTSMPQTSVPTIIGTAMPCSATTSSIPLSTEITDEWDSLIDFFNDDNNDDTEALTTDPSLSLSSSKPTETDQRRKRRRLINQNRDNSDDEQDGEPYHDAHDVDASSTVATSSTLPTNHVPTRSHSNPVSHVPSVSSLSSPCVTRSVSDSLVLSSSTATTTTTATTTATTKSPLPVSPYNVISNASSSIISGGSNGSSLLSLLNGYQSALANRTLFLIGAYTIGKERIPLAVHQATALPIYAAPPRMKTLRCLDLFSPLTSSPYSIIQEVDEKLSVSSSSTNMFDKVFTSDVTTSQVHIVNMSVCSFKVVIHH